jgi:hypothetical protein
MGRLPGERTCVSLLFAVVDRQSLGWRRMTMTPRTLRRLQDLRRQLFDPPPHSSPRTPSQLSWISFRPIDRLIEQVDDMTDEAL